MQLGMVEMECDGAREEVSRKPKQKGVSGARSVMGLDPPLVKIGREEEPAQMEDIQVFGRVLTSLAKGECVRGKWVDDERFNENGEESVRSRFVAVQFAWHARGDTFAGLPPLSAFWLVVSFVSSVYSTGIGYGGMFALYDVSVAFFHARIDGGLCAFPPRGEGPSGIVYQLKRAPYSTAMRRQASLDWLDIVVAGQLKVEKGSGIQRDRKSVKILVSTVLNRKAGERNTTKRTVTPSSKVVGKDRRESADELSAEYATTYRNLLPTAFYVSHDRFDVQQAAGYLMRGMTDPARHHWLLLQRLASYLEKHPQFELFFEFPTMPAVIVAEVDSDWASEPGNGALSSAEGEFDGIVNGLARRILLRSVLLEMGFDMALQEGRGRTISMAKIHTEVNRADMQTKPLEGPSFLKLLATPPLRAPPSGRMQVFGVMLAATPLGGVQAAAEVVLTSQEVLVIGSPAAMEQIWTMSITVMLVSTLAITFLSAWVGYRIYMGDETEPVEIPPVEEQLALVKSETSRHRQTAPIKPCWTWSAVELRAECIRLSIDHGQLKAQMV
ncbi:unnamed protein product, partial [Prorocentrum cordatum]